MHVPVNRNIGKNLYGKIIHDKVIARQEGDFPVIEPINVHYTDKVLKFKGISV